MENKDKFLKAVGNNIRTIRTRKGIERKEAASGLGITIQAYGEIENGHVDLNISRLFEISNLFQVTFSEILNVSGDTMNYTSQNNTGGYHVQKVRVMNTTDDAVINFVKDSLLSIKKLVSIIDKKKT